MGMNEKISGNNESVFFLVTPNIRIIWSGLNDSAVTASNEGILSFPKWYWKGIGRVLRKDCLGIYPSLVLISYFFRTYLILFLIYEISTKEVRDKYEW